METRKQNFSSSRRKFLTKHLPMGTLLCLGCKNLLSAPANLANFQEQVQKSKYLMDSGMSVEEVFRFTFNYCVPVFKNIGKKIGNEKLLNLLTESSADNFTEFIKTSTQGKAGDMKAFAEFVKGYLATPPYDKASKYKITEESDKVFEVKYTDCLMAKLYKEMNASDIGYAIECAPSDKIAKAFNPKMGVKSIKNIMKGDDVCIERFYLEA